MSRLWSRFGIRALALLMLLGGVGGGVYLGKDRETQQVELSANASTRVDLAEQELIKERAREVTLVTANRRAAEREASLKAVAAAKAAAERAKKAEQTAAARKKAQQESSSTKTPSYGPIPSSCKAYTGNKATGCALLLDAGFKLDQMPCLDKLWTRESHWNVKASNSSSGAYGIPQAVPGSKMASVADDWRTNPVTQIKWGLGYIKSRYDTPCGAWQHSEDTGWY